MPRSDKGYSRGITASEDLALPVRVRGGWGEGASLRASRSPHLDARRPQTREEAYLNGTPTKRVCGQRRRWAFFTTPIGEMNMLKQMPTEAHLSRMYHELARLGASCVGAKRGWPYEPESSEELLALACDMSRFDPRLLGILVDYLSNHWAEINPAKLRQFYAKMKTPQAVAVVGEFLLANARTEEIQYFVSYLSAGLRPVETQFYFYNLYAIGGGLAERATEEGIYEYKKWGFLACERPGRFGSFDPASRKNILRRLFEKKGEISLKDYLSALLFSISRQQALLDIKSSGIAEPAGRGRNARWKMAVY